MRTLSLLGRTILLSVVLCSFPHAASALGLTGRYMEVSVRITDFPLPGSSFGASGGFIASDGLDASISFFVLPGGSDPLRYEIDARSDGVSIRGPFFGEMELSIRLPDYPGQSLVALDAVELLTPSEEQVEIEVAPRTIRVLLDEPPLFGGEPGGGEILSEIDLRLSISSARPITIPFIPIGGTFGIALFAMVIGLRAARLAD